MALTTYVAGDVLTAQSLNDNFTFAAANPPASAAGLVFISATTYTAQTTVSMAAGTFTSTFTNYKVFLRLDTSDVAASLRVNVAGTPQTTSNYDSGLVTIRNNGTAGTISTSAQTSANFTRSRSGFPANADMTIFGPQVNAITLFSSIGFGADTSGDLASQAGGGMFRTSGSHDGLTFIFSVAASGSFRVYGIANS